MALYRVVDQQRRLAAAGHAGDAGEQPERQLGGGTFFRLLPRGIDHFDGCGDGSAGLRSG